MYELLPLINYSPGPYYTTLYLRHPITLKLYTTAQEKKQYLVLQGVILNLKNFCTSLNPTNVNMMPQNLPQIFLMSSLRRVIYDKIICLTQEIHYVN